MRQSIDVRRRHRGRHDEAVLAGLAFAQAQPAAQRGQDQAVPQARQEPRAIGDAGLYANQRQVPPQATRNSTSFTSTAVSSQGWSAPQLLPFLRQGGGRRAHVCLSLQQSQKAEGYYPISDVRPGRTASRCGSRRRQRDRAEAAAGVARARQGDRLQGLHGKTYAERQEPTGPLMSCTGKTAARLPHDHPDHGSPASCIARTSST